MLRDFIHPTRYFLLVCLQFLFFFAKAQSATNLTAVKDTAKVKLDFVKVFYGEVDSLWRIVFSLESKAGNINGKLNYVDRGVEIPITGKMDKLGNLSINGFDKTKNEKININGKFIAQNKITGSWYLNAGTPIKHRFYLNENSSPYDAIIKNLIMEKGELISGVYSYKVLRINQFRLDLRGTVSVEKISASKFRFKINVFKYYEKISNPDVAEDCEGEIEGIAYLDSLGIGHFSDSDCGELKFNFLINAIDIDESECNFYHGLSCGFFGVYHKNKK